MASEVDGRWENLTLNGGLLYLCRISGYVLNGGALNLHGYTAPELVLE